MTPRRPIHVVVHRARGRFRPIGCGSPLGCLVWIAIAIVATFLASVFGATSP